MAQYLVAIQHPDDFDPFLVTESTVRDIDVLNEEMEAAGVRMFAGGLAGASNAKSLRAQPKPGAGRGTPVPLTRQKNGQLSIFGLSNDYLITER